MVLRRLVVHQKSSIDHVARDAAGRGRNWLVFAALYELDAVAFRIFHHQGEAMVGAAFNLSGLEAVLNEIPAERTDIVGRKGDMIHAVGGLEIRSSAESDPLLPRKVADGLTRFNRGVGRETQDVGVKML